MVIYTKIPINVKYKPDGFKIPLDLTIRLNHTNIIGKNDNPHGIKPSVKYSFDDMKFNDDTVYLRPHLNAQDKKRLLDQILTLRVGNVKIGDTVPKVKWEDIEFEVKSVVPELHKAAVIHNMLANPFLDDSTLKEAGISVIAVTPDVYSRAVAIFDIYSASLQPVIDKEEAIISSLNSVMLKPSFDETGYITPSNVATEQGLRVLLSEIEKFEVPEVFLKRYEAISGQDFTYDMKPQTPLEMVKNASLDMNKIVSKNTVENIKRVIKGADVDAISKELGGDASILGLLRAGTISKLSNEAQKIINSLNELPLCVRNIAVRYASLNNRQSITEMFDALDNALEHRPIVSSKDAVEVIGGSVFKLKVPVHKVDLKDQEQAIEMIEKQNPKISTDLTELAR
jgi:hypothetical protein